MEGEAAGVLRRAPAWAVLVVVLVLLGRTTIVDGSTLSVVWPAAGAAVLWLGSTPVRWWPLVLVLVGAVAVPVNLLTGADAADAPVFLAANLVQVVVVVLFLRAAAPRLWAAGGGDPLTTTTDLAALAASALVGSVAGAAVATVVRLSAADTWTSADFLVWWGRNFVGIVAVVALGLLLRRSGSLDRVMSDVVASVRHRSAELFLLLVASGLVYWAVFGIYGDYPVAFPLLVGAVWAGLRFAAPVVHVYSLAVVVLVTTLTLNDIGPFGGIVDVHARALVVELFSTLVLLLGLVLSLAREERHALVDDLARTRHDAAAKAAQLEALVDTMRDGVTLVEADGTPVFRNRAGSELVGEGVASGLEMRTVELKPISPDDAPLRRALALGETVTQDLVVTRPADPDHEPKLLEVTVTPLPPGSDGAALVLYRDVTDEREYLRSVESFAAVVAHDLNNPLTVISGWIDAVLDEIEDGQMTLEDALPALGRVQRASLTMRELIRDLLAFSRAAHDDVDAVETDLTELASGTAELRREALGERAGTILVAELPPAMVEPALVRQIFDNLIGNATKYVRPGELPQVTVTGRSVAGWVEITVADRGIGIPHDKQAHVFDAFFRAHSKQYDGHGLGLSICRRIVDRYGGDIRAHDNAEGPGAAVTFTLPGVKQAAPTPPHVPAQRRQSPGSRPSRAR